MSTSLNGVSVFALTKHLLSYHSCHMTNDIQLTLSKQYHFTNNTLFHLTHVYVYVVVVYVYNWRIRKWIEGMAHRLFRNIESRRTAGDYGND